MVILIKKKTKLRQKEIIEKEKERLDAIESMSEQDKDKLFEENKKLMETIKKIEHAEIKEWMLDHGEKEDEITEESIEKNRDYYFYSLYNDDYTYRKYNKDGTYELVRDDRQEALDREEERNLESGKNPSSNSGSSNVLEYDYGITIKLTEYVPISGGNISELNKIPDLFLNKRSLLVLENNDDKCFLYCYMREFLNPITKNRSRITVRDKELAVKIIEETNLNFENVSISEIDKIEKKLKVNINVFSCNKKRRGIWDKFGLDCSKYISSPSLTKDCMLKFSGVKIEHTKDIEIYDFINNSVIGGLCVCCNSYLNNDNNNSTIAYQDVSSLYPAQMRNKMPLKNYKFVELKDFNINKYGEDKDYSCILLCHVKTTDKVKNDHILKQFPALISKTNIYYDNLSDYQKINLKEDYKSSGKLINHLGSDENNYLSFEMYKLLLKLGYDIEIKKIFEYYHSDFMKNYIDFLYDKKTEYKKIGDKSMMMTYKILMNSLYGSMLTRVENFRDFKIITNSKQADFYTKRSNFNSRVIINKDLTIVEMNKIKCVYNSPILIGSIILQNSKVLLFDYMYNKFPRLFGKENMKIGYVDTDSIVFKIENMKNEEYQNFQKNNPDIFGCKIGLMEDEIDKNDEITVYIGLSSK